MKLYFEKYRKEVLPGLSGNAYSGSRYLYESIYRDKVIEQNLLEYEKITPEFKGGMIILSTEVNSLGSNTLVGKLKSKINSISNRIKASNKIDAAVSKNGAIGWTIGKFLHGRYKDRSGKIFDENSLSIELVGIDTDKLDDIANDLAIEFNQESVLVKNYNDSDIYFIYA